MKDDIWHSLPPAEVVKKLGTNLEAGLSEDEVKKRRKKFGRNLLPEKKPLSKLRLFLDQIKSPLIYILFIADIIVLFFKEFSDAIVIFLAIVFNTIFGYFQELKASRSLEKLRKAATTKAVAKRGGRLKMIDCSELVPGDIFIINPGDKIPADGRIIKANNLKINEMALSGEWLSANKKEEVLAENTPLADRDNMVYMGTIVESGTGVAVVTSIGTDTEIGKIAEMVGGIKEEKTPFQKKISHFSKIIGIAILFISFFVFLGGAISGRNLLEIFITSVAIAVAAIPEGLPIAITVILAVGMQRILKKKGLVRKLTSAETLGGVSVIATDKTGTLTEGKMRVIDVISNSEPERYLALKIAMVCSQAFIENPEEAMKRWVIRGTPTDRALLFAGIEAGIDQKKIREEMKEMFKIPFDSISKYKAKFFLTNNERSGVIYVSGAPEKILGLSKYYKINNRKKAFNNKYREDLEREVDNSAKKGLRVIAVAERKIRKSDLLSGGGQGRLKDFINELTFVGLIVLKDPLRKEAKKAISVCRQAGIKPIIVTGDHKLTAKAIAQELGFAINEKNIIEGKYLDQMSNDDLKERLEGIQVYARVEPKHKMRIIQAWQDKGEVIAMTGDGVNDAPALKKADIGIALDSGTEIAKEVSDLVLLTNNFNIVVAAIEEGRAIIHNIRKVITYLFSDSFTETILVGLSIVFGFPLPVTAAQILWVNLIEDSFPNIALALEPKDNKLMNEKPRSQRKFLTKEMKFLIVIIGFVTDIFLFSLFFWLWKYSG
ncbi:MAG TPA: HAD family hydrolase, partial [Candidatus Parcubacteria bacterium]|nr:HAD family hydrolase [Candidatus Parcubacteria bacterium]